MRLVFNALIFAFFVSSLLLPTFFVNKLVFGAISALVIVRFALRPAELRLVTLSPVVVAVVFVSGYVLSIGGHTDPDLARQLLVSSAVLMLIYPIVQYDVDLDWIVKASGIVLAACSATFFAALLLSQQSALAARLMTLFIDYRLGYSGNRDFAETPTFVFQFSTCAFLLLPFALFLHAVLDRRSVRAGIGLVVVGATIVVSGSRGLVLTSLGALAVVIWQRLQPRARVILALLAVPVAGAVASVVLSKTYVFSAQEMSNGIKLGHLRSFIDGLTVQHALVGEGLGAYYYSAGRGYQVAETEISPLDMIRYVGFLGAALLYTALLVPSWRARPSSAGATETLLIFVLYLLLSMTNPVLFNSAGFLVVLWYWRRRLCRVPPNAESPLAPNLVLGL